MFLWTRNASAPHAPRRSHTESQRGAERGSATLLRIAPEPAPAHLRAALLHAHRGTGLGLAIVRRMVESWGAEITVDSTPGEGAVVHLRVAGGERSRMNRFVSRTDAESRRAFLSVPLCLCVSA
ncbi:MAG: ATP-binding protein [Longimicrobiaceae bacterium]